MEITFPISFQTNTYKCFTNDTSTDNTYGYSTTITSIIQGVRTPSSVTIYKGYNGTAVNINYTFDLLAIGI